MPQWEVGSVRIHTDRRGKIQPPFDSEWWMWGRHAWKYCLAVHGLLGAFSSSKIAHCFLISRAGEVIGGSGTGGILVRQGQDRCEAPKSRGFHFLMRCRKGGQLCSCSMSFG